MYVKYNINKFFLNKFFFIAPSEESRRIYEMEMLGDSSDDDETDPPPPFSFDSQIINPSSLTTQQLQQRNQRAAAAAEQQRNSNILPISSSSNILSKPNIFLTKTISSASVLNDSTSIITSRLLPSNENEQTSLTKFSISINDDLKKVNSFGNDIKPPHLQKSNTTDESNLNKSRKLSLQFNQIKKEAPPILDLYDSELKTNADIKVYLNYKVFIYSNFDC